MACAIGDARAQAPVVAAPGPHAPTVTIDAHTPIVDITAPTASGVSHNTYTTFNVPGQGLILNNATAAAHARGHAVPPNPNLAGSGPARVIVNEVLGTTPSQLQGVMEVAGAQADVVVANPNGITCAGCEFVNTPRVVLTTGRPDFAGEDALGVYRVTQGAITVREGLRAPGLTRLDLWARRIVVDGEIETRSGEAWLVAGANGVRYNAPTTSRRESQSGATRIASEDLTDEERAVEAAEAVGRAGRWGIDVAEMGGIFASHIELIATDAGVGVRNLGHLAAAQRKDDRGLSEPAPDYGRIRVMTDGRLDNDGRIVAWRNMRLTAGTAWNRGRGVVDAAELIFDVKDSIANEGQIGGFNVVLGADEVANYRRTVKPWSAPERTRGSWHASYDADKSGRIDARTTLTIAAQRMINGPGAVVRSAGNLRLYGNSGRWQTRGATPPMRALHNTGTLASVLDVDVTAQSIENRNSRLAIHDAVRTRSRVDEWIDSATNKRYDGSDVRLVKVDGIPVAETRDGKTMARYARYEVDREYIDAKVSESRPGLIEAGRSVFLRGRAVNDGSQIIAGERFRHEALAPGQTIQNVDAYRTRTRIDNGSLTQWFTKPCDDGNGTCRAHDPPERVENWAQSTLHPMEIAFIRERGVNLSDAAIQAHSQGGGTGGGKAGAAAQPAPKPNFERRPR
ncbi:filamentous hemagglutinin N-terminal domain-containing protein [Pararobbsia silviterrae]|nr:filamentous hemagglutinin N-terminal domain-containing protein [Pararobbsia silviterrae]